MTLKEAEESIRNIRGWSHKGGFEWTRIWILEGALLKRHSLERVHAEGHTHAWAEVQISRGSRGWGEVNGFRHTWEMAFEQNVLMGWLLGAEVMRKERNQG